MKKLIIIALATVVALSLVLMPVMGVSAASPKIEVSGSFGLHTWDPYKTLEDGPNVIYFVDIGADWIGNLVGSDIGCGIEVDRPDGRYVLNSITTWTGDLIIGGDTYSGSMKIITASRGDYTPFNFTGTMTLVGLTGDLAGVHGILTFGAPPFAAFPYPVPYSGWIMF